MLEVEFIYLKGYTKAYIWQEKPGHYVIGFVLMVNC